MLKEKFYHKLANTSLDKRLIILTFDHTSPLHGMTLHDVYLELQKIDDKLREDEIRREQLLTAVEPFMK
jgi:hypothetical protein